MADLKTKRTAADVEAFLDAIGDETKRQDAHAVLRLMREVTGEPPALWGSSIVGFGAYRYHYASGHSGEWPIVGFSPRKQNLTIYITPGFAQYRALLAKLGKHKTAKSCLYVNRLADVDLGVLRELVARSVAEMREKYPD